MKKVTVLLTIPQAEALRELVFRAWEEYQVDETLDRPPAQWRAIKALEDAMEEAIGRHYKYRITDRS